MGKVLTHMTMSLDGYIADLDDQPGELFDWYSVGEATVPSANESVTFEVDAASAEILGELTENVGALVSGRRLFDIANGWNDAHPAGMPVVVVTHHPPDDADERWPRTTFVDGVELGIATAREIAGDRNVTLASPNVIAQALELGLVDEICVSLVPVLFGEGIPYFAKLNRGHLLLKDPVVVQGRRALHRTSPMRSDADTRRRPLPRRRSARARAVRPALSDPQTRHLPDVRAQALANGIVRIVTSSV